MPISLLWPENLKTLSKERINVGNTHFLSHNANEPSEVTWCLWVWSAFASWDQQFGLWKHSRFWESQLWLVSGVLLWITVNRVELANDFSQICFHLLFATISITHFHCFRKSKIYWRHYLPDTMCSSQDPTATNINSSTVDFPIIFNGHLPWEVSL